MAEKANRPILIWVIAIYILLSSLWGIGLSLYTIFINLLAEPAHKTYTLAEPANITYTLIGIGIAVIDFIAAINLLRLKKNALYLFIAAFSINIISVLSTLITPEGREAFFGIGILGVIVSWPISLLICLYCAWLVKKKILI